MSQIVLKERITDDFSKLKFLFVLIKYYEIATLITI